MHLDHSDLITIIFAEEYKLCYIYCMRKLLGSIFSILLVLFASGNFIYIETGLFCRKVAYTRCDVLWSIERRDFVHL
jgi:hypothetical protein